MAKKRKRKGINANLGMLGLLGLTLGPQLWQNREAIMGGLGDMWSGAKAGVGGIGDWLGGLFGKEGEKSFGEAFSENRAKGNETFTWNGNKYHTKTKEES